MTIVVVKQSSSLLRPAVGDAAEVQGLQEPEKPTSAAAREFLQLWAAL